jgi:hypothetical protein
MSAGQRVTIAREYLDGIRRQKVGMLPPSVLVRECAELRRQLGQVLDVAGAGLVLPEAHLSTVLDALEDAATLRTERAAAYCVKCAEHPAGACDEHLDDLDAAERYRQLTRELGGSNERG